MSPAGTRRNMLNIFIAAFAALVVIAAAYIYLNNATDQSIQSLTVGEIVDSSDEYLGSIISVEGFFYHGNSPEGEGFITAKMEDPLSSSFEYVKEKISVNYSNVNITLEDQVKYQFTGTLTEDTSSPVPGAVILMAEEIVKV